jgi:hypothetical protein
MNSSGNLCFEEQVRAIRRESGRSRSQVPRRRHVHTLPALEVHHLDVDGRTAVGFFRNEEREAFLAKKRDAAPVGGKDRRLVREPVVGQPTSLAARGVPLDEKQVGEGFGLLFQPPPAPKPAPPKDEKKEAKP